MLGGEGRLLATTPRRATSGGTTTARRGPLAGGVPLCGLLRLATERRGTTGSTAPAKCRGTASGRAAGSITETSRGTTGCATGCAAEPAGGLCRGLCGSTATKRTRGTLCRNARGLLLATELRTSGPRPGTLPDDALFGVIAVHVLDAGKVVAPFLVRDVEDVKRNVVQFRRVIEGETTLVDAKGDMHDCGKLPLGNFLGLWAVVPQVQPPERGLALAGLEVELHTARAVIGLGAPDSMPRDNDLMPATGQRLNGCARVKLGGVESKRHGWFPFT